MPMETYSSYHILPYLTLSYLSDMLMDVDEFADLCLQEVKRYKAVTTSMCLMM